MTQKFAYVTAAGMAAFMVVLLAALGAYIVLHGQDGQAMGTAAGDGTGGQTAPLQSTAPQSNGQNETQPGAGGLGTSGDSQNGASADYPVSADQAAGIALGSAVGASLLQQPRLVNFQGVAAYEVQLDRGVVYVDASSGQVLYNGANTTTGRQRRGPRR